MAPEQIPGVERILGVLEADKRQIIVDELAGAIQTGKIQRKIPYLKCLIKKQMEGEFIPERSILVAKKRHDALIAKERLKRQKERERPAGPVPTVEESMLKIESSELDPALKAIMMRMGKGMIAKK